MASTKNPNGNKNDYSYDAWGRLKTIADPYGNEYICDNDRFARTKTTSFRAAGSSSLERLLTESYDQWGRLISRVAYPNSSNQTAVEERFAYDYLGNIVEVINPKAEKTTYVYSPGNELVKVIDPSGRSVDYSYDSLGNLSEQKQYEGTTPFIKQKLYDERGALTQTIEANGRTSKFVSDAMGLPIEIQEAGSRVKSLQYDALNRETSISSGDEQIKTTYGSYGLAKLETIKTGAVTSALAYTYTPRGLVSEKNLNGRTTRFEYNLAGSLTKMTDPYGLVYNYSYNKQERVETLTVDGKAFGYAYYPNGLLKSTTYPSFTGGQTLSCHYVYYNAKRLTEMSYLKNGAPYLKFSYSYDPNGNIVSESVNGVQEKTYNYNNRGQLESTTLNGVGTRVYDYDSRGNRTKATGPVTELDDRGESTYTWDAWDRLGSIVQDGQTLSSFSYDGTGLRYAKTTAEGTISYDCDNNGRVIAESTSEGVKAQNVWGNGILARKAEGAWYTYITNSHGDVIEVLDESGTAVNRYQYDEWGNATTSEESIENPIRYSGEYFDEETGLYYLRARYYDPSQARFISKDSYEGQLNNPESLNQYTYCENNPVMFVDPSGHVPIPAIIVIAAMYLGQTAVETVPDVAIDVLLDGEDFDLGKSVAYNYGTNLIPVAGGLYTSGKLAKRGVLSADEIAKGARNAVKFADSPLMKQIDDLDSKLFNSWHQGGYETTADSLIAHFNKHKGEVGAEDIAQYIRKAEGFKANLRGATKSYVSGATEGVVRYSKNGKYIDLAPDGRIISFGTK